MKKFSSFKSAWHLDRIKELRSGKDIVPAHVQLIISDLCNQNCRFCAYRMNDGFSAEGFAENGNKNPVRFIPAEKCREILLDCAEMGVGAVEFTGGGEPTVHHDWESIIGYAQELGLETGLVTNGVRLRPCKAVENLTWLRISLDAGTEETYKTTRDSSTWTAAIRSISYAAALRKPYVGVGFVITRDNYSEIVQTCSLLKTAGIPYIRLSAMFSRRGILYYAGLMENIHYQIEEAKELEDDKFKVVDFFNARIDDMKEGNPHYTFCGEQQFVLYIGGNQKIYTCCTNAYTLHGEIGDLHDQTFLHWMKNTRRYDFNASSCHHCQFNDKNRVINFLLDRQPEHVNFV